MDVSNEETDFLTSAGSWNEVSKFELLFLDPCATWNDVSSAVSFLDSVCKA